MADTPPPGDLVEDDFERIEDAVMETARGRWFLREYARRMRAAETSGLLDAIARIERVLTGEAALPQQRIETNLHLAAIAQRSDRLMAIASMLREQGYDGDLCTMLDREANALESVVEGMRASAVAVEPAPAAICPPDRASITDHPGADDHVAHLTIDAVAIEQAPPPQVALMPPERPAREPNLTALAAIDSLPFADKLTLFA